MTNSKNTFCFIFLISLFFFLISSGIGLAADTLTITTYYPSPYGVYNEMRSTRMAIGPDYINNTAYCWQGSCTNNIASTTDLVVEGNVGIGTTGPGTTLDVVGSPNSFNTPAMVLLIERPYNPGNSYTAAASFNLSGPNPTTRLDIALLNGNNQYTGTTDTNVMTLLSNGNVGIGTTSPTGNLDVENSNKTATLCLNGKCSANSLGTPGYSKLPGGLIIEWGAAQETSGNNAPQLVTLPLAFPNACLQAVGGSSSTGTYGGAYCSSATQIYIWANNNTGGVQWIAIGY